jgi:hypothetical protein
MHSDDGGLRGFSGRVPMTPWREFQPLPSNPVVLLGGGHDDADHLMMKSAPRTFRFP